MSDIVDAVLADLTAEGDRLEALVADLPESAWRLPTPAPGWDVATQVAHLAWTDEAALAAATDKAAWDALVLDAIADPDGIVDSAALTGGAVPPADLLARWHGARTALAAALRALPDGTKLPWFGPPMSAASMATARFMETWAHSLDVHDALGVEPEATDRIRHVAHLGIRTRDFSFRSHELTPPDGEFRIELVAPSGEVWVWGPDDAESRVSGSAEDFCRLVTQRVHRDDTDLVAIGPDVEQWLAIAQAFAGPAGEGRQPRG
ncbi:MAG: TIGR03084 family metal-binding protein [Nocardioidaceae bacterium]